MSEKKCYVGDGAYVDHDGYGLVLTTEDGVQTTNSIYLELAVLSKLLGYVHRNGFVPVGWDLKRDTGEPL